MASKLMLIGYRVSLPMNKLEQQEPFYSFQLMNSSQQDLGGFDLDEALATVAGESQVVIAAASKSFVSKLPVAEAEEVEEKDVCSVCMEGFEGGGNKRVPCGHVYHSECIILWLSRSNSSCPLCRRHIFLS
ncbi:hypothetical protein HN51_035750 [Arachis hypogaea]